MSVQRLVRTDTGEHQELRRVECAARQDHFTPGVDNPLFAWAAGSTWVRTIKSVALQILHADGTIIGVEQHASCQGVKLDLELIRMTRCDLEQAFARSQPLMSVRAEWREAQSIGVASQQSPIVWIQPRLK